MPAPTNTSFLTAVDLGTITATSATAVPITQRVDFGGSTSTVYYSFTAPPDCVQMGANVFGDLTTYRPSCEPYEGPAASPSPVCGGAIIAHNRPCQFPVTAGTQYFLEIAPNIGNPSPANLTLTVYIAPAAAVPAGSIAVNDDNPGGFPLALLSGTTNYTALKFIPDFPYGEGGDVIDSGTVAVEDTALGKVALYNSAYQRISASTVSTPMRIRACQGLQKFCVATNENPTKVYTLSPDGTLSAAEVLTAMTSCNAAAFSNTGGLIYHAFTGNGVVVRQWNTATHSAAANLAAGIANYKVVDILVTSDDKIVVGYYKDTVTRAYQVLVYDAAGTTLHTFNSFPVPIGNTAPRLAYAIDDPNSFWVMIQPSTTAGLTEFLNVKISDGSILTTRNHEQFEDGVYGGAETATPVAFFGAAFSCPFWITRVAQTTVQTFPLRRQRRFLLPSSDNNTYVQIPTIEILMGTGIGLAPETWGSDANTPQGANPQIMFRLSKDGGKTWGPERVVSAGQRGQFKDRVRLLRATGNYRNAVLEVTVSDPVDWQFLAALGTPVEGSS